ncbi:MAG: hypothetical protein AABX24_02055 [Nanoarchaeota archaeon]
MATTRRIAPLALKLNQKNETSAERLEFNRQVDLFESLADQKLLLN